ncbi:putative cytochrome P450 oxidoreductase [Ilyonectria destructans]|nr:putative cytochrome P450 oxidoreductase [Ilyonectria destructans]
MATLAAVLLLGAIKRRYFSPLSRFPGPFWASITRWWLVLDAWGEKHQETMLRLHEKYGPIVRTTPFELQIADPSAISILYGAANNGFTKGPWYGVWSFSDPKDSFTETDNSTHAKRRRNAASGYAMTSILMMEEKVNHCTRTLLTELSKRASSDQTVMMDQWLLWYAFDVIGELAIGKELGFLKAGHDKSGWCHAIEEAVGLHYWLALVPYFKKWVINRVSSLVPFIRESIEARASFNAFAANAIAERMNSEEKESATDMITFWMAQNKKKPEEWTRNHVAVEASSSLFAGSDTTAIVIRAIFYYTLKHPAIYAKLQREVDQVTAEGKIKDVVSFETTRSMPYLLAVAKEAMRIWPSVAFPYQRYTPAEGVNVSGEWIPGSVLVGSNAFVIHRDKTIFGHDAETFRPDRWLDSPPEKVSLMNRHMIQFGAGSRTCLGKNISIVEIQKVVPTIMTYFDLALKYPEKAWKTSNHDFHSQKDIEVVLKQKLPLPWA